MAFSMLHTALAVAGDLPRPYQTLRWATVEGKTLKNYTLIARHLCDRWQQGPQGIGQPDQTTGDGLATC